MLPIHSHQLKPLSKTVIREKKCLSISHSAGMYRGESGQWAAIFTAVTNN